MGRSLHKGPFVDDHLMKQVDAMNAKNEKKVVCFAIFKSMIENVSFPKDNLQGQSWGFQRRDLFFVVLIIITKYYQQLSRDGCEF